MTSFDIRAGQPNDRAALINLIHTAPHIHNHLDWRPPEAWLGSHPFYLAWGDGALAGAIAAPPDPPDVTWIRLAAIAPEFDPAAVLAPLWERTRETLAEMRVKQAACMLLDDWFVPLLEAWHFRQTNDVVVLSRQNESAGSWKLFPRLKTSPLNLRPKLPALHIRPIVEADLPAITAVDNTAFDPPWQYSQPVIQQAITHSNWATVAELEGRDGIVGYQISSGGRHYGHLARLAVKPELQNRGIGRALIADLIRHFEARGAATITVNTQRDNHPSIALYQSLGFKLTGEHYPVWQFPVAPNALQV
jgi:ribosomal-protein-alanine N-acetyltransferase